MHILDIRKKAVGLIMNFIRKHGFTLLRWGIAIASFIYLIYILYNSDREIRRFFSETLPKSDFWFLVYLVLLMPVNWLIESLKWKTGIRFIENISFISAIKSVLAGVAVAFVSPNRTGEFIGRITALCIPNRKKGVFVSVHISLAQTLITIIAGIAGLTTLFLLLAPDIRYSYLIIGALLIAGCLWIYFRFYRISEYLTRKVFFRKFFSRNEVVVKIPTQTLVLNLILSAIRYLVFCVQFIFALKFAGVDLSLTEMSIAISLVYFIMTIVPSFAVAEIGIKGSVAVYVFGFFTFNPPAVVLATSLLWVINLFLPALAGTFFLAKPECPGMKENAE